MDIVVTGIGLISALGNLETTWKRLLAGQVGISQQQPFPQLSPYPLALIAEDPNRLSYLTHNAVADAISDTNCQLPGRDWGVAIGSSRGQQAVWEQLAASKVSQTTLQLNPVNWSETLLHAAAIATARQIGTQAPVLAPMAACATGIWAIAQGMQLIQTGQCQRVLAGAIEAPITPLTLVGFERMGALAQTGAFPFDRDRQGLVLGEGGAVLVLEPLELAKQRGAKIYGRILGFGFTADGYHVSTPDPSGKTAIAAVKACLQRSHLPAEKIDFIHAHGTATQLNDRNEAQLIQRLFPPTVAVSSSKGAIGHTLGASGAIGIALCLMALKEQLLPPCVGLQQPEFDLDFVRSARPASVQHTLCFSFGFGGQNAAICLGRVE